MRAKCQLYTSSVDKKKKQHLQNTSSLMIPTDRNEQEIRIQQKTGANSNIYLRIIHACTYYPTPAPYLLQHIGQLSLEERVLGHGVTAEISIVPGSVGGKQPRYPM
jgi:hypothetical protein